MVAILPELWQSKSFHYGERKYNYFYIQENKQVFCYFIRGLKKRILFIINPISGGKQKLRFPVLARALLDMERFDPEFVYTEWPTHASQLAAEAVANHVDTVVAVGGDGTINEIASVLEGTGTRMGIIPCGSGNGLARALKISLSNKEALLAINRNRSTMIDSGLFNDRKFFNMAGVGFDAHISFKFASLKNRGLKGYLATAIREFSAYRPENYLIEIDGNQYRETAFMISIANSSQYGNNAHIAPGAELNDGLFDVCIIKPFPLSKFPLVGYHLFNKTVEKMPYIKIIKGKLIRIERETAGVVHIDGEPLEMQRQISVEVKPSSLEVLN